MVFAMPVTVSAYDTYVGLKIESVNNPDAPVPTEWCLPGGATTMTINDGSQDIDTVTTSTDTCPLGTIWSGLVSLTASGTYSIGINASNSASLNVHVENGYSWYGYSASGSNCDTYCESLGGTCVEPGDNAVDLGEPEINTLGDLPCIGGAGPHYTVDYSPMMRLSDQACWSWGLGSPTWSCSSNCNSGFARYCTCDGLGLTYTFTFQAPAA